MTRRRWDGVLEATLAIDYVPAANLRGAVAGATWRYLLPSMERRRMLCIGRPSPTALEALRAVADEIVVVEASGAGSVILTGQPAVRSIAGLEIDTWLEGRADGTIDLAWVGPQGAVHATRGIRSQLGRLLAHGGVVIREDQLGVAAAAKGDGGRRRSPFPDLPGHASIISVRPIRGEIRMAVGLDDASMAAFFDHRGVRTETGWLRPVRTLVEKVIHPRRAPTRHIALIGEGATLPDVPTYVADVAADAGLDLRGYRCGLAADGAYNTQKVLLYLLQPDASTPTIVVKLTRDSSVNARLETERDALRHLEALGLATDGRVPTVRFAGRHAGLAIVGEAAIEGTPYVQAMGPEPADGTIVDATAWLTKLGAATVRMASASDVASALLDLHGRYLALCQPLPAEADRLRTAIDDIGASSAPFPVVFQHGDAGTWNLLVGPDHRVSFLDWENAEPDGMPLWDVLYLLRSQAVVVGRRAGTRRRLAAIERFLFERSPLSDLVVDVITQYADRVGLERALVEPVFHLCWMHQALKEATRVTPARVRGGHFNRLLRRGIERRTAPTLQRVFGVAR